MPDRRHLVANRNWQLHDHSATGSYRAESIYFSSDGARRDKKGYYWITGRINDVLNVSGNRLDTAEIESTLVSHLKIAEAVVVSIPHNIKGQAIYAYVMLNHGEEPMPELYTELRKRDRADHHTGHAALDRLAAQNAFRQDHAAYFA